MANSDLTPPAWITQPLSPADIAAILQGGCDSGAYMPAVTYHEARVTMAEHGDDVLGYLDEFGVEWPRETSGLSWSGLACYRQLGAPVNRQVARLLHLRVPDCGCGAAGDCGTVEHCDLARAWEATFERERVQRVRRQDLREFMGGGA